MSPHLGRLGARARPAGSDAADDARRYCRVVLKGAGFVIKEQPFEYSAFGGAWATPAVGVLAPLAATAAVVARASRSPLLALVPIVLGAAILFVAYAGTSGVLHLPFSRRRATNLIATRGVRENQEPHVWLVAHIDSKWQPVSMLVRIAGIALLAVALVALAVATIAGSSIATPLLVVVWVAAIPLMLSVVGDYSHGALDNASGVAAVLEAAEQLSPTIPIGVLITDAEELALAGARAWGVGREPGIALNCDSIDDEGPLTAMYGGRARASQALVEQLRVAAARFGEPLRAMRLLPGVLVDSVALAQAGWTTVTLSRGTLRTLRRIHTRRDTLAALRGTGIAGAALVLARAAAVVAQEHRGDSR